MTDTYDTRGQLTGSGTAGYAYDAAGNPTTQSSTSGYTYNAANQLTATPVVGGTPASTIAYDTLGERTTRTPSTGTATAYTYDQAQHLTGIGPSGSPTVTYAYDGDGLMQSRTASSTTTHLAWDTSGSLPTLASDGTTSYLYGPDGTPIEQITSSTPLFYHHDQQGTTRLLTNTSGASVASYTYDAYGNQTAHTGTTTTVLGYDAQYTDPTTGSIYLRARWYDPSTVQFVTRDPLNAQTGQPYSYAGSDPADGADPTGMSTNGYCVAVDIAALGVTGGVSLCLIQSDSGQVGFSITTSASFTANGAVRPPVVRSVASVSARGCESPNERSWA